MNLSMLRMEPDALALADWATRYGQLSHDGDYGYALHSLLMSAFGTLAPKPFRYLEKKQGLLAYTTDDFNELLMNARLATPDVARALGLEKLDVRSFPSSWQSGQRLGFEIRLRPIVRTVKGKEIDAFLHTIEQTKQSAENIDDASMVRRSDVYLNWLVRQLETAAKLESAAMESFSLTRVIRKGKTGENTKRKMTQSTGPDVIFKGVLEVADAQAFNHALVRGIGRHRSFGFGMLLLRPV